MIWIRSGFIIEKRGKQRTITTIYKVRGERAGSYYAWFTHYIQIIRQVLLYSGPLIIVGRVMGTAQFIGSRIQDDLTY